MTPADPHERPLDYAAGSEPPRPPQHRSATTWFMLMVVWGVGLVFWTGYIVLILYAVWRVFGGA